MSHTSRFGFGIETAFAPIFGGMVEQSRAAEVALPPPTGDVVVLLLPLVCAFADGINDDDATTTPR